MKSVIDELYNGDRSTAIRASKFGAEYKKTFDRVCDLEQKLLEKIPQFDALFKEYQNAEIDLASLAYQYEFEKGFKSGVRLALEVIGTA
ncbi:hypothetical protein SAMN02910317_01335 [Ruminococcaceae bacterium FB2012]|nr:hypothetical protein SAMN02910317_01335 [Ruminococcaceae bacterium FB2012]